MNHEVIVELLKYMADTDVDGHKKITIANTEIKMPTDVQDHWAEAVTLLASAARAATAATTTGTGSDVDVGRFMVGEICVDVTAVTAPATGFAAGEGLRVIVEGKDEVTGKYKILYDSDVSLGGKITAPVTDWATIDPIPFRLIRVRWEIIDSSISSSFTFRVTMQAKA